MLLVFSNYKGNLQILILVALPLLGKGLFELVHFVFCMIESSHVGHVAEYRWQVGPLVQGDHAILILDFSDEAPLFRRTPRQLARVSSASGALCPCLRIIVLLIQYRFQRLVPV